jgi:hypothetical protein
MSSPFRIRSISFHVGVWRSSVSGASCLRMESCLPQGTFDGKSRARRGWSAPSKNDTPYPSSTSYCLTFTLPLPYRYAAITLRPYSSQSSLDRARDSKIADPSDSGIPTTYDRYLRKLFYRFIYMHVLSGCRRDTGIKKATWYRLGRIPGPQERYSDSFEIARFQASLRLDTDNLFQRSMQKYVLTRRFSECRSTTTP